MNNVEEIVISGISGRFPECSNIEELKHALLRGEDLLTADDRRFPAGFKGLPKRQGKVPHIDKFDASFFGLHPKQAHFTDPRQRILLETAYEAIIDAGYNPKELKGTKTGVFVGLSLFTNFKEITQEDDYGYSVLGVSHTSAANRISYYFDLNGPSYALDTGCSSSLYAFSQAVDLLKKKEIDYAIVGGTHLGISPEESLQYQKLNMLSPEGKCKVFNKERNGFARSETICCYFLQRKTHSRRIYAVVVGAKTNTNGYVKEGYTVPSAKMQLKLMEELYRENNINIEDVSYVEMHGTGSRIGDIIECQSLMDMFCKNRKKPLLVGSIKSNMGHGENASGLAAMTKVLLAMETAVIPANIHLDPIDESLPGIGDKKLQIVAENTYWKPGLTGINSFGFGGANAHVILKPFISNKEKQVVTRKHRLVQVSGRNQEAVNYFLEEIQKNRKDEEFLRLVDEVHKFNIEGHHFRGFAVLGKNTKKEVISYKSGKRPIWFIYSGMGSHWPGMGKDLMSFEIFGNTLNRCASALKPYGIDLIEVIMNPSEDDLKDLGNCFCAIIAIGISLTDLLASFGIKPDFFAGHSLGETACAYANGDLTPEQAVLLAYSKYYAVKQQELPLGQMAAVGLSDDEMKKFLPKDVFIACINSRNSVTISGLQESVKKVVKRLTEKGIFARLVYTGEVAFHTKYLMDSDKHMLDFVRKIIPNPKPRSEKWITTSYIDPAKINENWVNYNCAEYHTNNYLSPVIFNKIYERIPSNAIVIEIAPHGLMQPVMKKELGPENTLIHLLDKNVTDNQEFILSSIGKIYNAGGQPNLTSIYNEASFPVKSGTKMLAPLVKWDHGTSWFVPTWKNKSTFGQNYIINLSNDRDSYLKGHNINCEVVMPVTGYLEMVWKVRAEMSQKDFTSLPVIFENVEFKNSVTLPENENIVFFINILKETGYFEIFQADVLIVTGNIQVVQDTLKDSIDEYFNIDELELVVKREDFYKEMQLRGCYYWNTFQGLIECDVDGLYGKIEWFDNYVTFLDSMLQLSMFDHISRLPKVTRKIKKIVIDPIVHGRESQNKSIVVHRDNYRNIVKTRGIEIYGLNFLKVPLKEISQHDGILETFQFVCFDSPENEEFDLEKSLAIAVQIVIQNTSGLMKKLTIGEVQGNDNLITESLKSILSKQIMCRSEYMIIERKTLKEYTKKIDLIVLTTNFLHDSKLFANVLKSDGFIIYIGNLNQIPSSDIHIIFRSSKVSVLRLKSKNVTFSDVIFVKNSDFQWLEKIKKCYRAIETKSILLVSQNEECSGIIGLQKCLTAEKPEIGINAFSINGYETLFSLDDEFYKDQICKNLAINIFKNQNWGTFVYLPLEELHPKQTCNASLCLNIMDDFSTLDWIEKPNSIKDKVHSEVVKLHYSALNSVCLETPTNNRHFGYGLEYSGMTTNNQKVMGLVQENVSLEITSDAYFTWEIPISWSLEQAATIPLAYIMCYYGLVIKGKMEKNSSILIHDATSCIGLAAISISLSLNGRIFACVPSKEKRTFLKSIYPHLDFTNIVIVDALTFGNLIQNRTEGKGVDFVVSTFNGDELETSLNSLSQGGKYLEIGNTKSKDISLNSNILSKDCSLHRITLKKIFEETSNIRDQIYKLVLTGIESGVIKPLVPTVFKISEIEEAFIHMSNKKFNGKCLLKIREEDQTLTSKILANPRLYFNPEKTYIIIGGLGGVGLELSNWLINKGAKKIILNARRQPSKGYQLLCIKKWAKAKTVFVQINLEDTSTLKGAEDLIKSAEKEGPVGGIFNAAMVLQDANIDDQTEAKYEEVFKAKLVSGKNMDIASKKLCSSLDHFVVFSSIWAGRGSIGQSNYIMANAALEELCEKRKMENLPALAVQWGPIGEAGFLASTNIKQKISFNVAPQRIDSCLDTLERFLLQKVTIGSSLILSQWEEITKISLKSSVKAVADILGIENFDFIDKRATLSKLGLDSLMLAEVKHSLYRHFELDFGPEEIRNLTFEYLIKLQSGEAKIKTTVVENFPPPLLSEKPIIKMNEGNTKKILFMVHPIEGYLHYLIPLSKKVACTVYGIQCTRDSNHQTIQENAKYFLKLIKLVQIKGPYFICGYSYGATLGFEIALQLEMQGDTVELIAIDGAPDYARQVFSDQNEMNRKIIKIFPSLFKEVDLDKVTEIIKKYSKPEDGFHLIFKLISKETGLSLEDVRYAGEHYFSRCTASFLYQPAKKFTGKIKLIRRLHNPQAISGDYGLYKICCRAVDVTQLNGDHISILFGDNLEKLSKIINDWIF